MSDNRPPSPLEDVDVTLGGMRLSLMVDRNADAAAREEFQQFFERECAILTGLGDQAFATLSDFLGAGMTEDLKMPTGTDATLEALHETYLETVVVKCRELGADAPELANRGFLEVAAQSGLYCYIAGMRFCYEFFAISSEAGPHVPLTTTSSDGRFTATLGVTCAGHVVD